MKTSKIIFLFAASLLFVGCQPAADNTNNAAKEAFERNSQTVIKMIADWENETVDYSIFADDYFGVGTGFGQTDTTRLAQMKENDPSFLAAYDFDFVTEPLNLLPGVNPETKEMDGSVRYYGAWKVTKSATDSTEAKSGTFSVYAAYVFNEEGKITRDLFFGDFTGLMNHINN
ncbi:MAG: hypothetical protein OEU76_01585 [Cyclobacteriaceae bacterium]|nr:hypothetical protein [Cyclobacteriaceae bacterium]